MTASEDPAPPINTATAGAAEPPDDLEHWLSDLRTEVAENPSGWIGAEPHGEDPVSRPPGAAPVPHGQAEAGVPRPTSVGRHRTPD